MVLDPQEGRKYENFLSIVHPDELFSNKVTQVVDGSFYMGKEFMIVVISQLDDDE